MAVDLHPPRQKVSLVSKLGVEGHFDSLDLMTEFDGGAELKVHAFLDCRKGQQQQGLSINVLEKEKNMYELA